MKALKILAWISGVVGGILILLGVLALIFQYKFFGVNDMVNYFHGANSFLLLAICCLLYKPGDK